MDKHLVGHKVGGHRVYTEAGAGGNAINAQPVSVVMEYRVGFMGKNYTNPITEKTGFVLDKPCIICGFGQSAKAYEYAGMMFNNIPLNIDCTALYVPAGTPIYSDLPYFLFIEKMYY